MFHSYIEIACKLNTENFYFILWITVMKITNEQLIVKCSASVKIANKIATTTESNTQTQIHMWTTLEQYLSSTSVYLISSFWNFVRKVISTKTRKLSTDFVKALNRFSRSVRFDSILFLFSGRYSVSWRYRLLRRHNLIIIFLLFEFRFDFLQCNFATDWWIVRSQWRFCCHTIHFTKVGKFFKLSHWF